MPSRRQCITSDQALPAKHQHINPCPDCPWARTALNGWLGGLSSEEWLAQARSENKIDCHTLSGAQCAGAAIFRANTSKLPRDSSILQRPADHERVFATQQEFLRHHSQLKVSEPDSKPAEVTSSAESKKMMSEARSAWEDCANSLNDRRLNRDAYRQVIEEVRDLCNEAVGSVFFMGGVTNDIVRSAWDDFSESLAEIGLAVEQQHELIDEIGSDCDSIIMGLDADDANEALAG